MTQRIIFIGGIHGVGKGTLSEKICATTGLIPLSASDLIKWHEVSPDGKNKKVDNILSTQERLLKGLKHTVHEDNAYLLDGHFCLLNKSNQPEKVPIETFVGIDPNIISVIVDDIAAIINRLKLRDGKEYDLNTLNEMQKLEVEYAKEISVQLNIPLIIIKNSDPKELIQLIIKRTAQ
ncbi:MAG: AAA family ATPase [Bacteroidetes bacterium]|nr:AAA family ATPase [Bacteroidota bacterium]